MDIVAASAYLTSLQQRLTAEAVAIDGGEFSTDEWTSALGRGRRMFLQNGKVFERAGVSFSDIASERLPPAASTRKAHLDGCPYRAGGVSAVFHPRNPYCPTAHLNVRWFAAGDVWWFGGGMDLTPYYGFVEDCQHFHRQCRDALDEHDKALYGRFKKSCDEYFFLPHRNEARGIGGIFFDDFSEGNFAHAFSVLQAVGDAFARAYFPLIKKRQETPYGDRERQWQQHRRGRYVEFNLVYDRGTLFGLQSGGRADAILMSLPPSVSWGEQEITPAEKELLTDFLPPRDWAL